MGFGNWLFRLVHGKKIDALGGIPGPEPTFPLGNAGDFTGEAIPWEVLAGYGREYGEIFRFFLLGTPTVSLCDAELVDQVLISDKLNYYKHAPVAELTPVLTPHAPFLANRKEAPMKENATDWEAMAARSPLELSTRPVLQGRDQHTWLAAQIPVVHASVIESITALKAQGGGLDLLETMRRIGFAAFSRMGVGHNVLEAQDSFVDFIDLAAVGDKRLGIGPGSHLGGRFPATFKRWTQLWEAKVKEARGGEPGDGVDLLSFAVRSGSDLSDEALANEIGNLFFGGLFSTTSSVLTALNRLFMPENATILAAVRAELAEHLGDRGDFDWAAMKRCRLLDGALREAQRIHPPVPIYYRNSSQLGPVALGGHELPPDTAVMISNWGLHHDPDHWGDPEVYRPARWLDDAFYAANEYGSKYFWPFGRGERSCSGEGMSLVYSRVMMAAILQNADLQVEDPHTFEQTMFFAVMSLTGLKVNVTEIDA